MNRNEGNELYLKAQKLALRDYREKMLAGQSPFLPVLDDILQNVPVENQIPLGQVDIPLNLLVGTKTTGRTAAFASNFMPLLDLKTEFASKWVNLCLSHLEEGIRDPIRCYEYMGRFYVQEGNKRVSVLKYFDATSILGNVIRVVPQYSDDPAVQMYYEFMHFYPITQNYLLTFTKPGSYARLQKILGKGPDEKWSGDDRAEVLSLYNWVEKAFLAHGGAKLRCTVGDVLLLLLRVYTKEELAKLSPNELSEKLDALWDDVLALQKGDPVQVSDKPAAPKQTGLLDGFQFIPTLIGLFAVSEVIAGVERIIRGEEHEQKSNEKITNVLPDWKTIKQIWPNILSGGLIGTFIGAIPGAGGDIAVFVSYGASKSASKHPELYGTGIPNGVAATESANNGCSGGAMIPLLSLGVPGDSVTAILLGAFIMKGITPGPMMYVTELPTVYRVFAALMLANLCMLVVGCLGVRFFAKIVSIEKKMLYPIILVISLLGAFSINKNAFDVGVCVAFGIIGWLMNKYEFPLSPILLALILGPMCEKNFVRYMNIQRGNFFAITTSPIAMVFATVAILVIVYSVYNQSKINKRAAANAAQEKA